MHGLQALQGFEVKLLVTHRQVIALHQAQAQIAGEVSVLEISFVVGPGGQQGDVRRGTRWASGLDAVDQRAVGLGQTLHGHGLKGLRKLPRHDLPVFDQVAQTRRRLCALRQQPPQTIRAACEVECGQRQKAPTHRGHAVHGGQIRRMALHQRSGQLATQHELLRPIGIGHDVFEQLHALQHARFDLLPVLVAQHEREQIKRPRALRLVGGGIHVVGDAVVAHLPLQVLHSGVQLGFAGLG